MRVKKEVDSGKVISWLVKRIVPNIGPKRSIRIAGKRKDEPIDKVCGR